MEPATDLLVSSWMELGVCECGFGDLLGGRARWVNRPCGSDLEGLVYLLPKMADRVGVDVIVSLSGEDARALGEDAVWREVAGEVC